MFISFPLMFLAFLLETLNTHSVDTKGKGRDVLYFLLLP